MFRHFSRRCASRGVYFDTQSTTPLDPRVLDAMLPFWTSVQGNAHSRSHAFGWEAEEAVEVARASVAATLGSGGGSSSVEPSEIFFTSGATESNNIAIKGLTKFLRSTGKMHVVVPRTEHKCVLDSCRSLELEGYEVTYLPVQSDGLVNLVELEAAIKSNTALVSVMAVHNEIGVIQPLREIGSLCHRKNVLFHTDAAQAFGKIHIDVNQCHIDALSISGHKIYGPKGIGALYLRRHPRRRVLSPISGGGQERGVRSGTVPVPLVVGLGTAAAVALKEMDHDFQHVTKLFHRLMDYFTSRLPKVQLNGSKEHRYPGNINVTFEGVEGESLMMGMPKVAVSSGSACTSASLEPSYVLRAIGTSDELAHSSIRFGIGRFTTEREIEFVTKRCAESVERLRLMSPLWGSGEKPTVDWMK